MDERVVTEFIIIGQENCSYCKKAEEQCRAWGLPYVYYDLSHHRWLKPLLAKAGLTTVPQIFTTTGLHIGGFSDLEAWQ